MTHESVIARELVMTRELVITRASVIIRDEWLSERAACPRLPALSPSRFPTACERSHAWMRAPVIAGSLRT